MAIAAAVLLAGCGSSAGPPADEGSNGWGGGPGAADRSSQPLEALVIDTTAIVDGSGATRLMDLGLWVGDYRKDRCGGPGPFAGEGDRYDQQLFPDFDLIEREGLALAQPVQDPEPAGRPADEACLASTLPELVDIDKVFGEWVETVVYPTWPEVGASDSARESAGCISDEMGWNDSDLTLETVLPAADGVISTWGDLDRDEFSRRAAQLDAKLSDALTGCAKGTYEMFSRRLEEQRGPFVERHAETIAAAARALDEAGYVP